MHAPAYHCPGCGGPQSGRGPGQCDFCGAARVPLGVADPRTAHPCPACAALVAGGDHFCPRCGAAQPDPEIDPPLHTSDVTCPGCEAAMAVWPLDARLTGAGYRGWDPTIHGCRACGGAWVDRRTLDAVVREAQVQARTVDPSNVPRKTMAMAEAVVYRPCPRCRERMHRRNFARYSGIVVDECSSCGTYFDAGELEGIVEFVRAGGLEYRELRDAEETRRDLVHRRQVGSTPPPSTSMGALSGPSVEVEFELLVGFLRWLGRWIRRIVR